MLFGLVSLAFCFQEESISFLTTSLDSKQLACQKINRGFILTGVVLTGTTVFGGISFAKENDSSTSSQITPFSISDYYIGKASIARTIFSLIVFLMYVPMVPTVSLKAASYLSKISDTEAKSPSAVKGLSIFIVFGLSWIFFIPRKSTLSVLTVSGGIIGFIFIFLVPILLHWRSQDETVMLEQRLNKEARSKSQGLLEHQNSSINSATGDTFMSDPLGTLGLVVFSLIGLASLALPIITVWGVVNNN